MSKGIVFRIKKYALHDGPGIRTTVFLKGCPLGCWWCHNPEGISAVPQMMEGDRRNVVGRHMSAEQVMAEVEKDAIFYDQSQGGVTFSGGEPIMQPMFLEDLLHSCRRKGLHCAIDTSGHAPAKTFEHLVSLADLVLFDLKILDPKLHNHYTGVDNDLILENFNTLCRSRVSLRVRVPLIPDITATQENIHGMIQWLKAFNRSFPVDLLPYHRIGQKKYALLGRENKLVDLQPLSTETVTSIRTDFENAGFAVSIGG